MKKSHKRRVTDVYGLFGTFKSMVTFISKFGQREGQFQVKLGQIRSIFSNHKCVLKHAYPAQFCPRILNILLILICVIRCAKNALKGDVTRFIPFFYHCRVKNKGIVLNLRMRVADI